MSEQNVVDAPSHESTEEYSDGNFDSSDYESSESGGEPGPGMGQSKSSRRRRRKRKNKVAGDGPETSSTGADTPTLPFVMEGESIALAASAAPLAAPAQPQQARRPQPQQQGGQQQAGQGQAAGGKRWKKKFRDRDRDRRPSGGSGSNGSGRNDNPGNDFRAEAAPSSNGGYRQEYRPDNFGNQNGSFKRKNKGGGQQRDRGFVGPMDHSYRSAGDFGEAPPSTIQVNVPMRRGGQRHHGDSQPIDHSMPRPIPIPEGAQTHIYFFIEELFFQAKIQETAKKLGVKVAFIKNDKDALAELTDGDENKPALIVFDLNNANAKPLTLIPKLKTKLKRTASIVGFLSHLQGDLKAKAVEAGCDVVMPRAAFSQNLPNLLRRYGVEEEEEKNFNY
jgi:hypothetical protein